MKIAVISSTIFPCPPKGYAGLELVALQSAEGLAVKGHDVTLYAPNGSYSEKCKIRPFGPPAEVDEKTAYSTYWQELPDYDVIVDHSWQKWSYVLKAEGKLKAPVLGVMHAPVNTMYQSLPPVEKPCIVCLSMDQGMHFEALFEKQFRVAHNAIDTDFYRAIDGVKRTDRFLFLARFSRIKGPHLAIEACKKAGAKLDLVGDTTITNEPDYLHQCRSLCDGENIRLVGPASRGECVRWFSQANCFLHPNRDFREPFGLAPLEAMACGVPVIAWNRGAMKSTVDHSHNGWLVSSEEELLRKVQQVMTDGITTQMRDDCVDWVRSYYSLSKLADRYNELCVEAKETGGW